MPHDRPTTRPRPVTASHCNSETFRSPPAMSSKVSKPGPVQTVSRLLAARTRWAATSNNRAIHSWAGLTSVSRCGPTQLQHQGRHVCIGAVGGCELRYLPVDRGDVVIQRLSRQDAIAATRGTVSNGSQLHST